MTFDLMAGLAVVGEDPGPDLDALGLGPCGRRPSTLASDADSGPLGLVDEIELLARIDEPVLAP